MIDRDKLVEVRAYHIWEREGYPGGQHERHWRMAVDELETEERQKQAAPPILPPPLKRISLLAVNRNRQTPVARPIPRERLFPATASSTE